MNDSHAALTALGPLEPHEFIPRNPHFDQRPTCHECGLMPDDPIHQVKQTNHE